MKLISPIQAFIFASIGIHGSLLVMSDSFNLTLPGSTGSVMSVKLNEINQTVIKTETQQIQNKKLTKLVEQATTVKNKLPIIKQEAKSSQQGALNKQSNSEAKSRVVSLIYKELNNHFTYPKIAQKRNWQGQVLLAFRLSSNGSIEDIKINHSSGYNVLDQAAIVSLKKIGQLPQASSWLINGMEIQIPIIYQLIQG